MSRVAQRIFSAWHPWWRGFNTLNTGPEQSSACLYMQPLAMSACRLPRSPCFVALVALLLATKASASCPNADLMPCNSSNPNQLFQYHPSPNLYNHIIIESNDYCLGMGHGRVCFWFCVLPALIVAAVRELTQTSRTTA